MNTVYEEYWHRAMELKHQTHNLINDHNHPMAHVLRHETTQLVDDIQLRRNTQTIDDRLDQIQRRLVQAQVQGEGVLKYEHGQLLHQGYGKLQEDLRRMPRSPRSR